jgi:uncharacterized protein (TIGR03084 family)
VEDILAALNEQQSELDSLINPVDDAAWDKPSRCDGWSVSDVMLHLAQTNELALGSLTGGFDGTLGDLTRNMRAGKDVDDAAGLMVDAQRGAAAPDVYARWRDGVDQMMKEFRAIDPHARVPWVAGTLSAHTLCTTRLAETWIHTNDVAFGLGIDLPSPDRLRHIARLAWRTLPYAFTRAGRELQGSVAFELTAPNGTDTWTFADGDADTVVRGAARDLCEVAGQRADAANTSLRAEGPDAVAVLELVRTFA